MSGIERPHDDAARGLLNGGGVVEPAVGRCSGERNAPEVTRPVTLVLPATGGLTVTLTVAAGLAAPRLSVTTSEKVSVVAAATVGAVKVGCDAVLLDEVTAVPAVCVHA